MASKTIEFEAIDQTAEPLCAKIAPTEPATSIGFENYAPLYEKIQKRKFAHASFSECVLIDSDSSNLLHGRAETIHELLPRNYDFCICTNLFWMLPAK
jgi:hypothetical protein